MAEFTIKGVDRLTYKLRQLPKRIGVSASKRGLRKGANVVRNQARVNARRLDDKLTPESIAKNIVTQSASARTNRQMSGIVMRIGVKGGAMSGTKGTGNPGGDTWYWRLLEFGTSRMAARPFMRPAMEQSASAAFDAAADGLQKEYDKELAKLEAEA